jgi:hypothetical protein
LRTEALARSGKAGNRIGRIVQGSWGTPLKAPTFHFRPSCSSVGLVVFDEIFEAKPQSLRPHQEFWWSGYELKFKLIEAAKYKAFGGDVEAIRRNALVSGPEQQRKFSVDMSKYEYCHGEVERELDSYASFVYSAEMIVVEKLRAVCQQMPAYRHRSYQTPRARDFYDIWKVTTTTGLDLTTPENLQLIRHIFAAKEVPLRLLAGIHDQREFHRPDWPAVVAAVAEVLNEFDYYFEFVLNEVARLESLWVE